MMFALVDCNNFFASCEEVFNPNLTKAPLVILSNNDGMVIARSKKAKKIGVKMGDSIYNYRQRKDIQTLSSNFALYSDISFRVMQTLSTCTNQMEIYSIDEAFLQNIVDPLKVKAKVKKWTGIDVSIGIGPTKTLAKIASEIAKKSKEGVYSFQKEDLKKIPVADIWGIGRKSAKKLHTLGIYSAEEMAQAEEGVLQKKLGIIGLRIAKELQGTPIFILDEIPDKKKSIVCSRSFGSPIKELPRLEEALSSFTARAAEKLRSQQSVTRFLTIFIINDLFETFSAHITLPVAISYTPDLIHSAKNCLQKIHQPQMSYRKAGVMLSDFVDRSSEPLDLFAEAPSLKKEKAMDLLDQINRKYPNQRSQFAAEGTDQTWKSKKDHISAKYTSSWKQLLKVY